MLQPSLHMAEVQAAQFCPWDSSRHAERPLHAFLLETARSLWLKSSENSKSSSTDWYTAAVVLWSAMNCCGGQISAARPYVVVGHSDL